MNKENKYEIGDEVEVNANAKIGMPSYIGRRGIIKEFITKGSFDYEVEFDKHTNGRFKEEELDFYFVYKEDTNSVKEFKFKEGDKIRVIAKDALNGKTGVITEARYFVECGNIYTIIFDDVHTMFTFGERELELIKTEPTEQLDKFTQIGLDIGKFTDMKNKQYGSSVDATNEMMKVLMERYTYDDENYLMPKSLLQHILLQVRIMDKQNRIFNNPSGEGDSESPYNDITGYGIIGVDMVNK